MLAAIVSLFICPALMYLLIRYHDSCFHALFFFKINLSSLFISFLCIPHYFNPTIKRSQEKKLWLEVFFSSFPLKVVCLTKQHHKSNSTAVNRLQNWLLPVWSPRNGHIINTDLYCSQVANIHMPICWVSVDGETTRSNLGWFLL